MVTTLPRKVEKRSGGQRPQQDGQYKTGNVRNHSSEKHPHKLHPGQDPISYQKNSSRAADSQASKQDTDAKAAATALRFGA